MSTPEESQTNTEVISLASDATVTPTFRPMEIDVPQGTWKEILASKLNLSNDYSLLQFLQWLLFGVVVVSLALLFFLGFVQNLETFELTSWLKVTWVKQVAVNAGPVPRGFRPTAPFLAVQVDESDSV